MRFGLHTALGGAAISELLRVWQLADEAGFWSVSVGDHFYGVGGSPQNWDAVAMQTLLAARTERVRCGGLVYSVSYRHPAVLAQTIRTIDHISGGRAFLGLGAGWLQEEHEAHGIDLLPPKARADRFEEGVTCIRGLLDNRRTTFSGEYFELREAQSEPKPINHPLPIWIGGGGERRTIPLAARLADGWNVPVLTPKEFGQKVDCLRASEEAFGRERGSVTASVALEFGRGDLHQMRQRYGNRFEAVQGSLLAGSSEEVVSRLGEYAESGAECVFLLNRSPFSLSDVEWFADEVMPQFA